MDGRIPLIMLRLGSDEPLQPAAPTVLTTAHLSQLESASRVLLNPLAAPDATAWLMEAGRLVRDTLGGERVVLMSPTAPGRYFSEDAPEVCQGVHAYVEDVTAEGIMFSDPVVSAWNTLRQEAGREVLSWDASRALVESSGHRMMDSPIVSEVLQGQRFNDFAVLVRTTAVGDAMVWVLHGQHGGFAFGEATPQVLGTLLPSFQAGLDALLRFRHHRHALDAVTDAVVVFDADARVLHRNAALGRLLAGEPERDRLEVELRALAGRLRALGFPRRGDEAAAPDVQREVATRAARYTLRGMLLPPAGGGFGESFLVSVTRAGTPALPSADDVRARHGLTRREAEVALLLAAGLTNADLSDRLFISPHTVRRHVESVLSKLGLHSRAAVAMHLMG